MRVATVTEEKVSLEASRLEDIRLASSKMTGSERRAFQAEMALKYCPVSHPGPAVSSHSRSADVVSRNRHYALEVRQSFAKLPAPMQQIAEVVEGVWVIRAQRNGLAIGRLGFIVTAGLRQQVAEVVEGIRVVRAQRDGPLNMLNRGLVLPALGLSQPCQVPGVGVVGPRTGQSLIGRVGGSESPGPMVDLISHALLPSPDRAAIAP